MIDHASTLCAFCDAMSVSTVSPARHPNLHIPFCSRHRHRAFSRAYLMDRDVCRVCGEQPAFADTGVCRWESCEQDA